jgi:secreted PhoX family phosphatase
MTSRSISFTRRRLLGSALLLTGCAPALQRLAQAGMPMRELPLVEVADRNSGLPLLRLPEGFSYTSFGWTGEPMADGVPTPGQHDGMGVIAQDGDVLTLVRNHEIVFPGEPLGGRPAYDKLAAAGTTTLRFDVERGAWLDARASLAGTFANCAGGVTPWGSWLSCEEAVIDRDGLLGPRFGNRRATLEQAHGYVFEVPADGNDDPQPLKALGRFRHEAVAIDPRDGVLYQTEDNQPWSGVYRFVPQKAGDLSAGRLQMMAVAGRPDLSRSVPRDRWLDVDWVDIEDPEAGHNRGRLDSAAVYTQGKRAGGTSFRRPEGCWYEAGLVYLTDTTGGDAGCGQVFVFDPVEQRIRLVFESPDRELLDHPDNVCATPGGGLLLCEDRPRRVQRMSALTRDGELIQLAGNNIQLEGEVHGHRGDFRGDEWAGACFSPDGQWLFVNIQGPGMSFAITGPWSEIGV